MNLYYRTKLQGSLQYCFIGNQLRLSHFDDAVTKGSILNVERWWFGPGYATSFLKWYLQFSCFKTIVKKIVDKFSCCVLGKKLNRIHSSICDRKMVSRAVCQSIWFSLIKDQKTKHKYLCSNKRTPYESKVFFRKRDESFSTIILQGFK